MEKTTWGAKSVSLKAANHRAREDGKWVSRRKKHDGKVRIFQDEDFWLRK
jgi:hypothetical protein